VLRPDLQLEHDLAVPDGHQPDAEQLRDGRRRNVTVHHRVQVIPQALHAVAGPSKKA
jgi:hypothetical protein